MNLLFLGASSAYCLEPGKYQSNMLLTSESGKKMLIDCGSDVRHSLHFHGYSYTDIDAVYVSHLHSDHSGGLEWLGFERLFSGEKKPAFYANRELVDILWDQVLCGGMSSLEDEQANLASFFDIQNIKNEHFIWESYSFNLVKTNHYQSNGKIMPSFGLMISTSRQKIFITTDTRFTPDDLLDVYKEADLIFHDCETSGKATGQHARFQDLKTLTPEIKRKIWLYDYNDGDLPDAQKEGFKGFVATGQSFNFK